MKKMFFLFLIIHGMVSFAALNPPAHFLLNPQEVFRASQAVTPERFPNADDALVDDSILEMVEKDGTSVFWDDEYTKILTEKGRRDASTTQLYFTSHYGTAFVHRVELLKPNGKTVRIDHKAHSRVMIDPSQMGSNIYDPSCKIYSLSIPGVEIGDVVHLVKVRVTSKTRMPNTWCDYNLFEYTSPILKLNYAVSLPAELPLRTIRLRSPVSNTVSYATTALPNGRTLHTWKIRNVPQMFPEPDMPSLSTQVQRLMVSTLRNWGEVSKWYWNLCQPQLRKVTPEMREKVAELISGATSREEKIRRIFKFVSQEIRYMGITTEDVAPGYEPHDVSLTFKNRYGVCRDKAALLVTMLREAKIPAYPVLIHAGDKKDPEVPQPYFNHAITAVDDGKGGYQLMDSTDESTRDLFPAYLCDKSYLVARAEGENLRVSPLYPSERNLMRIQSDGELERNGTLILRTKLFFDGINDTAYRSFFLRRKETERRAFFERQVKAFASGGEVLTCEIFPKNLQDTEKPLEAHILSRIRQYPVRGEGLDLLNLPWFGNVMGIVNFVIGSTGLEKRKYPFKTEVTCGVRESLTIKLNQVMGRPNALPSTIAMTNGGLTFCQSVVVSNDLLSASRENLLKQVEFSPQEYLSLKTDLREMEEANRHKPLFVAKEEEVPDVEYLYSMTEDALTESNVWSRTRSWQKRILTYAGKKNNAEITQDFNPAWQSFELLSATVSNVNGSVKTVTPKEMNVMDASWAGSAPRYPAGKRMVINLPGVEIGSVITVKTRFTQKFGKSYRASYSFGRAAPVEWEQYSVSFDPRRVSIQKEMLHGEKISFTAVPSGLTNQTYVFEMKKVPSVKSERMQPKRHRFLPTVICSASDFPRQVMQWKEIMGRVRTQGDQHARALARSLTKGITDNRLKALAIRNEILRTVRVAGPSFLDLPPQVAFSSPDRTLTDRYGHAADRALLLQSMFEEVGLDPAFLLSSWDQSEEPSWNEPRRKTSDLRYYTQPILTLGKVPGCTVNHGDQYEALGTSPFSKAFAFDFQRMKPVTITIDPKMENLQDYDLCVELNEQGDAVMTIRRYFHGTDYGVIKKFYEEIRPEDFHRHHFELVGEIARGAVVDSPLSVQVKNYPAERSFRVRIDRYAVVDGKTLTVRIPSAEVSAYSLSDETRTTPVCISSSESRRWKCRLILPKGFVIEQMMPASQEFHLPNGTGVVSNHVQKETLNDGRIQITLSRASRRKSGEIPPAMYPAVLEYNRILSHPSTSTIIFSKP